MANTNNKNNKRKINAFGKSWGIFDISELERAIKLYERLNYLETHHVGSLEGAAKIEASIVEQQHLKEILEEEGLKRGNKSLKNIKEELAALKEKRDVINETNRILKANEALLKANEKYNNKQPEKISWNNFGSSISGAFQQNNANKVYEDMLNAAVKQYGDTSTWTDEIVDKFNNSVTDELSKSAGKYSKAASLLQLAADTFKSGVDEFTSMFKQGLTKQTSTMRQNALNIGVRTQATVSDQLDAQWDLNNQLGSWMPYSSSDDLRDNVSSSEIMEMWNSLAKSGSSSEEMFANAIDDVVTQKIVPYLDTSTSTWQRLVQVQPELQKNIRGINATNQEIAGNNYITEKLLDQIIYDMQPMSTLAENDLAMSASGASATINSIMEANPQMTKDQAIQLYKDLYKQQYRGADILKGGSLYEKMSYVKNMDTNIYASENIPEAIGNIALTKSYLSKISGADYSSTMGGTIQSTVGNAVGMSGEDMMTYSQMSNDSILKAIDNGNKSQQQLDKAATKEEQKFTEGLYQTEAEKQEKYMENLANELSVIETNLGHWGSVIETLLTGIKTLVATWVGGKVLSSILGLSSSAAGGGSGFLGALSGAAGGFAGVALGTVAGVALTAVIANGINEALKPGQGEHGVKEAEDEIGDQFKIDKTLQGLQNISAQNSNDSDNGWFANTAKDVANSFGATWMGIKKLGHAIGGKSYDDSYTDRNAEFYQTMIATAIKGNTDKDRTGLLLAYAYLLNEIDSLETMSKLGSPITKDELKKYAEGQEYSYYNIDYWVSQLLKGGYAPAGYNHEKATDANVKNYLRIGLNSVPYDNYPALLHEGEAVLTASTANELRNLVVEYRESNNQNVSLDVAISNQTTILVEKMSEIIQTIQSVNTSSTNTSNWSSAVRTSMRNMISTKSF